MSLDKGSNSTRYGQYHNRSIDSHERYNYSDLLSLQISATHIYIIIMIIKTTDHYHGVIYHISIATNYGIAIKQLLRESKTESNEGVNLGIFTMKRGENIRTIKH